MKKTNKTVRKAGQTLVEYGLIIALVSAVVVGTLLITKGGISNTFSRLTAEMEGSGT